MKTVFALAIISALFSCPVAAQNRLETGYPELPRDARDVAERSQACEHFAGEINGDGGERDKQVKHAVKKLKCDRLEQDSRRMKYKYRNNPKVLLLLNDALEWLTE